jgi:hypothetical protein
MLLVKPLYLRYAHNKPKAHSVGETPFSHLFPSLLHSPFYAPFPSSHPFLSLTSSQSLRITKIGMALLGPRILSYPDMRMIKVQVPTLIMSQSSHKVNDSTHRLLDLLFFLHCILQISNAHFTISYYVILKCSRLCVTHLLL